MAKVKQLADGTLIYRCPCGDQHVLSATRWTFNGDTERPTFTPSVLVTTGHHVPAPRNDGSCWCTYNEEHPDDPAPFGCYVCHSFVRDGQVQFLDDCTHALAGQTAPLPEWS